MVSAEGDVDSISQEPGTIAVPVATVVSDLGENTAGPAGDSKEVRTQIFRLDSSQLQQMLDLENLPWPALPQQTVNLRC